LVINRQFGFLLLGSLLVVVCRFGWPGLMLERGGCVCEPKGGLASRALTNPSRPLG